MWVRLPLRASPSGVQTAPVPDHLSRAPHAFSSMSRPAWETGDRTLDRMRKFGFIGQPSKAWKKRTICAVSLTAKLYVPPWNRIKHKGNGGREISISMSSTCRFLVSMVEMSIISSSLAPALGRKRLRLPFLRWRASTLRLLAAAFALHLLMTVSRTRWR